MTTEDSKRMYQMVQRAPAPANPAESVAVSRAAKGSVEECSVGGADRTTGRVCAMAENHMQENVADNEQDPGASTQMFRAFVTEGQVEATEAPKLSGRTLALIGGVIVLIAVVAALLVL
jgi:hypothetical protein